MTIERCGWKCASLAYHILLFNRPRLTICFFDVVSSMMTTTTTTTTAEKTPTPACPGNRELCDAAAQFACAETKEGECSSGCACGKTVTCPAKMAIAEFADHKCPKGRATCPSCGFVTTAADMEAHIKNKEGMLPSLPSTRSSSADVVLC